MDGYADVINYVIDNNILELCSFEKVIKLNAPVLTCEATKKIDHKFIVLCATVMDRLCEMLNMFF